jgi:hypothetical protein
VPVRVVRVGQVAVATGAGLFLLSGPVVAPALAEPAAPLGGLCGSGAAATVQASVFADSAGLIGASPTQSLNPAGTIGPGSPSGSPSPSPTQSSPTQSSAPPPSPTSSPTPKTSSTSPSRTPSPSRSTTPSKSPSPSPSKSPKPSKSPTPTPTTMPGAICVTASLVRRDSRPVPGGAVTYSIWVWSTVSSRQISATVSRTGQATDDPHFSLCPSIHGTTCSIGSLSGYQALELLVTDKIGKKATVGEGISLIVQVQGSAGTRSGGPLSPAEAAVSTVLGQQSSSSSSAIPPGIGSGLPPTAAGLPGTTVTPGGVSGLFPVVTPSAPSTPNPARRENRKVAKATTTASSLPFDPRLIGGQLAGLAVLAAAITMVVARLSLRTPQQLAAQSGQAAAAAPPEPGDTETGTNA